MWRHVLLVLALTAASASAGDGIADFFYNLLGGQHNPLLNLCSLFTDPWYLFRDKYPIPKVPAGKASTAVPAAGYEPYKHYWDFIVIGAGSAGSAVASRLSEGGKYTVLVLEAGKAENYFNDIPLFPHLWLGSEYDWAFTPDPISGRHAGLKDGVAPWARGKAIGGTSVINFMIYTRGHKEDYDNIAAAGNTNWGWNDIFPYFLKLERANLGNVSTNSPYHNTTGPLSVEYAGYRTKIAEAFWASGVELGIAKADYNDGNPKGISYMQTNTLKGHRNSAARAYLLPNIGRPNLDIFYDCVVKKINLENKVAKSVSYVHENRNHHVAYARKEVILSAGPIKSPQVLMLSGIGPSNQLQPLNITVVQDLKVGETVYDHAFFPGLLFTINATDTTTTMLEKDITPWHVTDWIFNGRGPFSVNGGVEGITYLKTNTSQQPGNSPDVELLFFSGTITSEDSQRVRKALNIEDAFFQEAYGEIVGKNTWSLSPVLLRPFSKGYVRLADADYASKPRIRLDYFEDARDLEAMVQAIKYAKMVSQTKAFQKYDSRVWAKPYPTCRNFTFDTDDYWRCALKTLVMSLWHPVATTKMGPASDPTAVVDPTLKVHGITGLRVCDSGVLPKAVAAHTNAPAIMIGEKCADLVKAANPV